MEHYDEDTSEGERGAEMPPSALVIDALMTCEECGAYIEFCQCERIIQPRHYRDEFSSEQSS